MIEHDHCTIFYFDRHYRPTCIFTSATDAHQSEITRKFATRYTEQGFRSDPLLRDLQPALRGKTPVFIRHQAAHDISDSAYRQTFYVNAKASEKIALGAQANGGTYYVNFYRTLERNHYSKAQFATLSQVGSLLCQLIAKHHRMIKDQRFAPDVATALSSRDFSKTFPIFRQSLLNGEWGLTKREADICGAIATGLSTSQVGDYFGITRNTVTTHRKRGYAKIGVSSRGGLITNLYFSIRLLT